MKSLRKRGGFFVSEYKGNVHLVHLSLLLALINAASAQSAEYRFRRIPIQPDQFGYADSYRLEIEQVRDAKKVFVRTFETVDAATMNPQGTSLAFTDQEWIFVWKPDRPMRRYTIPKLPDGYGEGIYAKDGLLWSPDSHHLLVWIPGTQGSMSLGHGHLFLLDTERGKTRYIDSVAKPRWIASGVIEYRIFHFDEREVAYYGVHRLHVLDPKARPVFLHWEFPDW